MSRCLRSSETTQAFFEQNSLVSAAYLASLVGDLRKSADDWSQVATTPEFQGLARLSSGLAATMFALNHDPQSAQRALAALGAPADTSFLEANAISAFMGLPAYWLAAERGDWSTALEDARTVEMNRQASLVRSIADIVKHVLWRDHAAGNVVRVLERDQTGLRSVIALATQLRLHMGPGEDAVFHTSAVQREAHVRTAVFDGEDFPVVVEHRDSLVQDRIAISELGDEIDRRLRAPWTSPKIPFADRLSFVPWWSR